MPIIKIKTEIKAEIEIVFDLSRSVDLHIISTGRTNEKAIAGKTSGLLSLGDSVTWRAKHLGVYQNLTSEITEFKKPCFFVDEMVQGAFKSFRHEHHFSESSGTTTMTDIFKYESPFGIFGKLLDFLFLKKYMANFLKKRNIIIKEWAESGDWKSIIKIN